MHYLIEFLVILQYCVFLLCSVCSLEGPVCNKGVLNTSLRECRGMFVKLVLPELQVYCKAFNLAVFEAQFHYSTTSRQTVTNRRFVFINNRFSDGRLRIYIYKKMCVSWAGPWEVVFGYCLLSSVWPFSEWCWQLSWPGCCHMSLSVHSELRDAPRYCQILLPLHTYTHTHQTMHIQ